MKFMIIVKATREAEEGVMPKEELFSAMASYHEELMAAGAHVDAAGLQPSSKGWRVYYDGDKRTVMDGPFAETKELISGFTIIDVKSREEAMEWSRRYPNPAVDGGKTHIEVREISVLCDFEPSDAVDRFKKMESGE